MFRPADLAQPQLGAAFLERASRAPDAPALAWPGGDLSYGELHALACGARTRLDELGIGEGERLALRGAKSPETIAIALACLMSRRPVLLPPSDLRDGVFDELLRRAGVEHVVTTEPLVAAACDRPPSPCSPSEAALMLTTSGSTGAPKVVPISHRAIDSFADCASAQFGIGDGTRVLSYCGLSFDLSLLEIWTTLTHGGCAVLVAPERATQGNHLLDLIATHEVDVVQGVPMLYALLVDAAQATGRLLPTVKHAILTGDAVPLSYLRRLSSVLDQARLSNVYGCTETNDSFIHEIDVARALEAGAVPLGRPLPGVSALVVDDGAVVAGVGRGELWVSTPFQTSGYLGRRHDGEFLRHPFGGSERVYFRTGDLVRRDSADEIYLDGRSDFQVKVRGIRVNLQAVEQTLLEDSGVREAAVVALDDPVGGKRLHAVIRRRGGAEVNSLLVRNQCARRLSRAAIPSIIEIVDQPLPRTTTGKVDRAAVKRRVSRGEHEHEH